MTDLGLTKLRGFLFIKDLQIPHFDFNKKLRLLLQAIKGTPINIPINNDYILAGTFLPNCRTKNHQTAERKTAKLPNEKLPNCRTKNYQTAERKTAKLPNEINIFLCISEKYRIFATSKNADNHGKN